jgi:PPM family protein phosphatase
MSAGALDTVALEKPLPSEIDVFGLTHPGRVRPTNADHFLIASFHRAMRVHASSLDVALPPLSTYSRGYLMLVADGVGGLARASEGSGRAIETIARYVLDMGEVCLQTEPDREDELIARLQSAVHRAHEALLTEDEGTARGSNATTLTMWIGIWPRAFVIHAGDSRCYRLRRGVLDRLTTDQTMAQAMVDSGVLSHDEAKTSRMKHVLVSALGSSQLDPAVTVGDCDRQDVVFLCTDGLTRHVSEDEIREWLSRRGSSEMICRGLIDLALDRGGEDNITAVMGKVRDV